MVRELLATKRILMVIDSAQHSEEIRPLLPSSDSCALLITTRRHNLAITSGIQRLHLSGFSEEGKESLALFDSLLGAAFVEQHASTLAQIAHLLGHLPLAVAIAAKRLAYEPGWTPGDFLRRLQPEGKRLAMLTYENQNVRQVLSESFAQLLAPHWQIMATLHGLGNRCALNTEDIARSSQQSCEDTADHLRYLYDFSLVQQVGSSGYQLHPLVRAYMGWLRKLELPALDSAAKRVEVLGTADFSGKHNYTPIRVHTPSRPMARSFRFNQAEQDSTRAPNSPGPNPRLNLF
jgi:hypothetical protein